MSDTDPFAAAVPDFPADRYERAGLSHAAVERARVRFENLPDEQKQLEVTRVASVSDGDLHDENRHTAVVTETGPELHPKPRGRRKPPGDQPS